MNKKFKASKSLLSYLENVLHRNGISYRVINNQDELFIETDTFPQLCSSCKNGKTSGRR